MWLRSVAPWLLSIGSPSGLVDSTCSFLELGDSIRQNLVGFVLRIDSKSAEKNLSCTSVIDLKYS